MIQRRTKRSKEEFAESVLASILGGTSFSEAMSAATEYQFQGGDLGWRKINDIPSMFQQIVTTLDRGETGMVTSASGYHLVYLADTRGLTQLIEQSATRHILIAPSEILDEESAKNLAQELSNRIRAGEDFADLAREYSEDIGSAQEGGDLGWVSPGQMVPEFEAAMADAVSSGGNRPHKIGVWLAYSGGNRAQDRGFREPDQTQPDCQLP